MLLTNATPIYIFLKDNESTDRQIKGILIVVTMRPMGGSHTIASFFLLAYDISL